MVREDATVREISSITTRWRGGLAYFVKRECGIAGTLSGYGMSVLEDAAEEIMHLK